MLSLPPDVCGSRPPQDNDWTRPRPREISRQLPGNLPLSPKFLEYDWTRPCPREISRQFLCWGDQRLKGCHERFARVSFALFRNLRRIQMFQISRPTCGRLLETQKFLTGNFVFFGETLAMKWKAFSFTVCQFYH